MSRLDELVTKSKEDHKVLTVRVDSSTADELKAIAKKIGIPRTKLVQELFFAGLDEFKTKIGGGNGTPAVVDTSDDD